MTMCCFRVLAIYVTPNTVTVRIPTRHKIVTRRVLADVYFPRNCAVAQQNVEILCHVDIGGAIVRDAANSDFMK